MAVGWQSSQVIRHSSAALGVAAGYFVLALIGTVLSVPPSGFAVIWPATAFLVSVLLLTPWRLWWLYPITVVPAHFLLVSFFEPVPFVVGITQIGGNFLIAISTALALRVTDGKPPDFGQVRTQLRYLLFAGLVVPAIANSLVILAHLANGRTGDFWQSWGQWMMASIFPIVVIPPVLVTAIARATRRQFDVRYLVELGIVSVGVLVLGFVSFGAVAQGWGPAMRLLPLPLLLWAAVRLGVGGAGVSLLALGVAIVERALRMEGPFANGSATADVIALQGYLIAISVPLMLLAALMEERRRYEDLLRRSEDQMKVVAASAEIGLWQWDEEAKKLWLTDHCRSMFGLPAGPEATPDMVLQAIHPDDRARVTRAMRASLSSTETAPREFRVARPDGGLRWFIVSTHTQFDKDNRPVLVSGMFQDVTQRVGAEDEAERLTRRLLALQDEERRSIARELNDFTAQHLVGADLQLAALKRSPSRPEDVQRLAGEASSSIQDALNEIRNFTFLLQPPEMEDEELSSVLRRFLDSYRRRTGIETRLRISAAADRLPAEQRRTVLRVVQESLANVHRHGGARNVSVNVRCLGGRLHLVVRDDGQGARRLFESEAGEQVFGIPVPGTAARIRQLGGKIEISKHRSRTTVHVAVPIVEPGSAQRAAGG